MPKSAPARRTRLATLAHRIEVVGRGQRPRWCFAAGDRRAPLQCQHCRRCPRQRWRSCGWQTWTTVFCKATQRRTRTDGSSVAASRAAQRPGSADELRDRAASREAGGAARCRGRGLGEEAAAKPRASQTTSDEKPRCKATMLLNAGLAASVCSVGARARAGLAPAWLALGRAEPIPTRPAMPEACTSAVRARHACQRARAASAAAARARAGGA